MMEPGGAWYWHIFIQNHRCSSSVAGRPKRGPGAQISWFMLKVSLVAANIRRS